MNSEARLKELLGRAVVPFNHQSPIIRYYNSGREILTLGNSYYDDNNSELAYILYHRYLTLFVEKIPKHPQFKEVSKALKKTVNKNLEVVIRRCESLKRDLIKVYREEEAVAMAAEKEANRQRAIREEEKCKEDLIRYHKEKEESIHKARDMEMSLYEELKVKEAEKRDVPTAAVVSTTTTQEDIHAPAIPDRSTKPALLTSSELRSLLIPATLMENFLEKAESNTMSNVETCGILAGSMSNNRFIITHLIIPKQTGTSDSCNMQSEENVFEYQEKYSLITLGWIHTHPSQTAFLSSVDLHNHMSYQIMLPEAIAIVCSPRYNETGFFSLTQEGLDVISRCRESGFHPHQKEPPLFDEGKHFTMDSSKTVVVKDLR